MAGVLDELKQAAAKLQEGAKGLLDKTDIDEKVVAAAKDAKAKADELLAKTDIDEKVISTAKDVKAKAEALIEKAKPGVEEAFGKASAEAKSLFDKSMETLQGSKAKDAMDKIGEEVSEQVEKIRAAATSSNSIHDFIQKQYHSEATEATEATEAPAGEPAAEAPAEPAAETPAEPAPEPAAEAEPEVVEDEEEESGE